MKIKTASLFILSTVLLNACGPVTSIPLITPTNKIAAATSTPYIADTPTPTVTPFARETPTPETVFGYPTPQLPIETDSFAPGIPFEQKSITNNELYIGKYVLRRWCKPLNFMDYCAITISSLNEKQLDIADWSSYVAPETGTDLTGRGYPDIVIVSELGNAAGEQFVRVFEAGDTLREILVAGGRRDWKFKDLNNDKSFEFVGDMRIWSQFSNCQALNLPYVYGYDKVLGHYVDETSKYTDILTPVINWGLNNLATYKAQNPNSEVPLCDVYVLISAYLVSGQTEKAWDILNQNYPPEKVAEYKIGFQKDFNLSP